MKLPRHAPTVLGVVAMAAVAALPVYRARLVDRVYAQYAGCSGCLDASVWANDALLLGAFPLLLGLSRLTSRVRVRVVMAGVAVCALLVYALDVVVFRLLSHRLLVADAMALAGDAPLLSTVMAPLVRSAEGGWLLAAIGLAGACIAGAMVAGPVSRGASGGWMLAGAITVAVADQFPRTEYIHHVALQNLWQVNRAVDPTRPYSREFWLRTRGSVGPALQCERSQAHRPSIIVVVVESLSLYHSRLFSGRNDFTPRLDALAAQGTWFASFHANGFSTETGLIALLTGTVPIPAAGRFGTAMAFTAVEGDFHRDLASRGYLTAFFTTGRLTFGRRDRWLAAIGIQHAEGADHPFYAGMPRGPFDAASDAALFARVLQWLDREAPAGRPFMATLLTVGTHPPFVGRAHGEGSEEAQFRQLDRDLEAFVHALEDRGFLREGILFVVGDHRAMTPVSADELAHLGPSAAMRVPAFALGATGLAPGRVDVPLQQVDLVPSLRYRIDGQACRDEWQGRLLGGEPRGARYLLQPDPMRRNELAVIEGNSRYRLVLDGDDTRWKDAPPDAREANRLIRRVNLERMSRMTEFGYLPPQP